jgi:hypothetical protein
MTFIAKILGSTSMSDKYAKVTISSRTFLKDFDKYFPAKVKQTPTGKQLVEYVLYGYRPESFLAAALDNNLRMASILADQIQRTYLVDLARFLDAHAPNECWGSDKTTTLWLESGGLEHRIRAVPYPGDCND